MKTVNDILSVLVATSYYVFGEASTQKLIPTFEIDRNERVASIEPHDKTLIIWLDR